MSDRAKIWYNTLVVSVKDASFGMPVFFGHMKEEMPLTLREEAPMTKDDARRLNPLQLAYIGDTVYDLLTRSRLLYRGYNLHHCHQAAVTVVNAHAQAEALTRIEGALTEEENAIGPPWAQYSRAPRCPPKSDCHGLSGSNGAGSPRRVSVPDWAGDAAA